MHSFDKKIKGATNEELRKIYTGHHKPKRLLPKVNKQIKKHNCLSIEVRSEVSLGAESTARSRPITRRNPNVTPKEALPPRSCSVGPSSESDEKMFKFRHRKRSSMSSPKRINNSVDRDCEIVAVAEAISSSPIGDEKVCEGIESKPASPKQAEETKETFLKESAEEHEYLLFLLRITEDIIINDFYSNSDIKQVFRFHIEANKNRLNVHKMHQHIANLCKELNIDCKEYQNINPEDLDSSKRFLDCENYLLNNEAFKKCQECSTVRTCSLYKLHPAVLNENNQLAPLMECSGDNNAAAISPSLLKLLEKLSLGRVTECTEPVASITTMNSPRFSVCNLFINEETNKPTLDPYDQSDFDTFVKELNDNECKAKQVENHILDDTKEGKCIALESPSPTEIYATLVVTSSQNLTSQSKSAPTLVQNSSHNSEKYDESDSIISSQSLFGNSQSKLEKNEEEPIRDQENVMLEKDDDTARTPSVIENNFSHLRSSSSTVNVQPEAAVPLIKDLKETDQLGAPPREVLLEGTTDEVNAPASCHQDSVIKVILQGSVNDDDYVMVKGPVYIYKPLLETHQPKLIVFNTNETVPRSRRNSITESSSASHRTFTIDPHPEQDNHHVDQGIQFDVSLHSMDYNNSMENILELTRRAYSQFNDLKLLDSDYDLMPQKDSSDNKYHHLMVDACTSISGVNITESLLLGDEYLVKNEEKMKIPSSKNENIDDYQNLESKLIESNYVTHRKLLSSVSLPKLKLNEKNATKNDIICKEGMVDFGEWVANLKASRGGELLEKCSSDLIKFDDASQNSSLRSEGETFHHTKQFSNQPT